MAATCEAPDTTWAPALYRQGAKPEETILYDVVRRNLETYLAQREADPDAEPVPGYVERTLRAYLKCGLPQWGVALVVCESKTCNHSFSIPFSCSCRGPCPRCSARSQARTAAHLVDHVLPRVPIRHWTFSFPKRVRYFLERDHDAASGVLRVCLRAVETLLRKRSPGAPKGARYGAVVNEHRAAKALTPDFHFHAQVTDGVFAADPEREGEARFFEAVDLTDEDVAALEQTIRCRVLRFLGRHGYLDHAAVEDMLGWEHSGFSLNAGNRVEAWDRFGLERLAQYAAKPGFALGRLERADPDTLIYRLPRPAHDGSTFVTMTPMELIHRLTRLIPPPHKNTIRFCGVLSGAAKLRKAVVASAGPAAAMQLQLEEAARKMGLEQEHDTAGEEGHSAVAVEVGDETADPEPPKPKRRLSAYLWAMLIARVLGALPLLCPVCSSPMRVKSVVTDRDEVRRILEHLGQPTEPPRTEPARGPPQGDFEMDQTVGLPEDDVWS
ncbi:MAG: transposase [Planctomycetota bacterium]